MNEETDKHDERISALVDGELSGVEISAVLDKVTGSAQGILAWQSYHVVGDAIRGAAPATKLDGPAFVARFRDRLVQEQVVRPTPTPAPRAVPVSVASERTQDSANDPAWRWKLVAGAASLAAVATLGWHLASMQVAGAGPLAQAPVSPSPSSTVQASVQSPAQAVSANPPAMLRDPRLDELMAAHKQVGGTSALQMPAGFLRNATFNGADR